MKCPPNSHYELCADTCSLGCSALSAPPQCPESCAEGCQCDPGFLNDGQACVPIQKCGCYHNGVYYEVGTCSSRQSPICTPPTAQQPHSLSSWHPESLPPTLLPLCGQFVFSHLVPSQPSLPLFHLSHGSREDLSKYVHKS